MNTNPSLREQSFIERYVLARAHTFAQGCEENAGRAAITEARKLFAMIEHATTLDKAR